MRRAVIAASVRTPVGKAFKGSLAGLRPDDLAAAAVRGALDRVSNLDPAEVEDLILGCAIPEAEQGMNLGRIVALRAGLPQSVPGMTLTRFCSSGLQSIAFAAQGIMAGMSETVLAGGVESMSRVPMTGVKPMANPSLMAETPGAYLGMGLTAENVAEKYNISREDQDSYALESHKRALAAQAAGRFRDEIVPVEGKRVLPGKNGGVVEEAFTLEADEGPRADTTLEALAGLKPAFKKDGSVTAGNSSQVSDGAAMALVMSEERAKALKLEPLAAFVSFAVAGVDPAMMGIGPVEAIPKALKLAGIKLSDVGLIELNEAFAAQTLAVMRELGLEHGITNVNGGAIALGHPLGCTGAKLTATALHEMIKRNVKYGLVTMCIGGGMGAAAVFENLRYSAKPKKK